MRSRPDAEFAQLIEEYFSVAGWGQGMGAQPALQRVVPFAAWERQRLSARGLA